MLAPEVQCFGSTEDPFSSHVDCKNHTSRRRTGPSSEPKATQISTMDDNV